VIYLSECIENSDDPDEIVRLQNLLEKAERIQEKIEGVAVQQVEA
jgi:hypothetical protein